MKQLQIEKYFFPLQLVQANQSFDPKNKDNVHHVTAVANVTSIPNDEKKIGIELVVSLDKDKSENPKYYFEVIAFGIFKTEDPESKSQVVEKGSNFLVGVLRERLASLTSRAPWGELVLHDIGFGAPPKD